MSAPSIDWVVLIWNVLVLLPGIWVAAWPTRRSVVASFARLYQVSVTPANGPYLIHRLGHGRRWRGIGWIVGGIAGFGIGLSYWALDRSTSVAIPGDIAKTIAILVLVQFVCAVCGYLVGGLLSQWVSDRAQAPPRKASLVAREPGQYVTRTAKLLPYITMIIGALLLTTMLFLPDRSISRLLAVALALLCAAAVWWTQRRVAYRGQQLESPEQRQVDNAVRARDAHRMTGAGILVASWAMYFSIDPQAFPERIQSLMGAVAVALWWIGLIAGVFIREASPRRVVRTKPHE